MTAAKLRTWPPEATVLQRCALIGVRTVVTTRLGYEKSTLGAPP